MPAPEVSVVIPTRFRETRLAFALDALAAQTLAPERFEVIVVRAPDRAPGPLTEAAPGLEARFLHSAEAGPAAQRNHGWRVARGELIAFTDDDCRPAPDWLERLLAARGPETILQGRTEPDPDERELLHGFARSMNVTEYDSWAPTCNIGYPRELLERCGGFDEQFRTAWGEDTDLALRAKAAGAQQAYVPEALVWHAVLPRTLAGALVDGIRRSNIHLVLRRHPEHRRVLDLGVFTKRNHAFVLPALVGLALVRRHPLLGPLLVVPYLAHYFDPNVRWSPFRLAYWVSITMARRALLDAVELTAMAVSSVRYRTLAL